MYLSRYESVAVTTSIETVIATVGIAIARRRATATIEASRGCRNIGAVCPLVERGRQAVQRLCSNARVVADAIARREAAGG
jgi:hypothetical protein